MQHFSSLFLGAMAFSLSGFILCVLEAKQVAFLLHGSDTVEGCMKTKVSFVLKLYVSQS